MLARNSHDDLSISGRLVRRGVRLAKIRGRFDWFEGTVTIADDPIDSRVIATVDLRSIDTNNSVRDENLCGSDFFHAHSRSAATGAWKNYVAARTW
jgi:polyisoprenoid-binding protein YceI